MVSRSARPTATRAERAIGKTLQRRFEKIAVCKLSHGDRVTILDHAEASAAGREGTT
jgi:hypothetical protein